MFFPFYLFCTLLATDHLFYPFPPKIKSLWRKSRKTCKIRKPKGNYFFRSERVNTIPYFTTVDRYFISRFLWNFLLCLFVIGSIFLVFDFFPKIEDIFKLFQERGSFPAIQILLQYYMVHLLYALRVAGSTPVLAGAMMALYSLEKTSNLSTRGGEIIPILTSGFSRWRVAIPFCYTSCVLIFVLTFIFEVLFPSCQEWPGANSNKYSTETQKARTQRDLHTGVDIQGNTVDLQKQKIISPGFIIPPELAKKNLYIAAGSAQWFPEKDERPSGYLLTEIGNFSELKKTLQASPIFVRSKQRMSIQKTSESDFHEENVTNAVSTEKLILTAEDGDWIGPEELFICTKIHPSELYQKDVSYVPVSLVDLWRKIKMPSTDKQLRARVEMHRRILQPFLDASLIFLSLPIILSGRFRSKFMVSTLLMVVILFYFLVPVACGFFGEYGVVSPLAAAWIPLFIFYPLAAFLFGEYYT